MAWLEKLRRGGWWLWRGEGQRFVVEEGGDGRERAEGGIK
jgi:hypothetical protein